MRLAANRSSRGWLASLALVMALAWAGNAHAAANPAPAKVTVADLAGACAPAAVQAVAARLPYGMAIKAIPNGPNLAGGTKYVPATPQRPGYCQVTGSIVTNPKTGKTAHFLATLPDALTASLYSHTSPMIDRSKAPLRTMPLCKFPEMARYDGKGDVKAASSWSCPAADTRMLEVGESGRQAGVGD